MTHALDESEVVTNGTAEFTLWVQKAVPKFSSLGSPLSSPLHFLSFSSFYQYNPHGLVVNLSFPAPLHYLNCMLSRAGTFPFIVFPAPSLSTNAKNSLLSPSSEASPVSKGQNCHWMKERLRSGQKSCRSDHGPLKEGEEWELDGKRATRFLSKAQIRIPKWYSRKMK